MNKPMREEEEEGEGAWAQFRRKYAVFYALLAHFLPKTNVKKRLLRPINERYVRFKQKMR